jgi:hypothetical protein
VTRTAAAVALAALVAAPGAAAAKRHGPLLHAVTSMTPPVHLFGEVVTARAEFTSPSLDLRRLHVQANFAPYEPLGPPAVEYGRSGTAWQAVWTWRLQCLTRPCIPRAPPTDKYAGVAFRPLRVAYVPAAGRTRRTVVAWPPIEVRSAVSPAVIGWLDLHNKILWGATATPLPPAYASSPALVFDAALGAGIAALAGAALLAALWLRRIVPARRARAARDEAAVLHRALRVFLVARERGDETTQRKALERIAAELSPRGNGLVTRLRELAWSSAPPETTDTRWVAEELPSALEQPAAEEEP